MMKKALLVLLFIAGFISNVYAATKPTLLIYCGITMVTPVKQIAKIIEKKHNCTIKITQGGSKDIYDSLKYAKRGDMYIPGSSSYRKKYKKDGFLLEHTYIGYNQAAIFVAKGNPKKIKDLNSLIDENISTILCNPKSGSIGKNGKKVLEKFGGEEFFEEAFDMAAEIGTDSRNINKAIIDQKVDMAINWRATAFFPENKEYITAIDIDEKYAPKKAIEINLLSFSKNKKIARAFMDYASSQAGQEIMKKYGFR
jgi:molybdate transport system substrate-binding protein